MGCNDEQLVRELQEGSEMALGKLMERYIDSLCRFSYSITGQQELAEEAVSDTFVKLWNGRERLQIRTSVRGYLYRAVRNVTLDLLRKEGKHCHLQEVDEDALGTIDDPFKELFYSELEAQIDQLINTLPEQRAIIFRMNRLEGLKYREIADILNISVHTVQNQMVAAVQKMTEYLPYFKLVMYVLYVNGL
ncbi:RNA polymerase sigma-70 factor [Echinicola soli]|uniref:RNA polymerase sigma-70 factor n=1 Tax=Echinicola soli TaxID=2591634 RepID=A0A514CK77_9BACT|nr:RNA polymerase sigma-70 factor [Echinicola soli]QDH80261.1 RNA polymerase sigma-70 factor [Echinicola soli]